MAETTSTTDPEAVGHEAGALHLGCIGRFGSAACRFSVWRRGMCMSPSRPAQQNGLKRPASHRPWVRLNWFKPVHMKNEESYRLRFLLGHWCVFKRKFLDIENEIRHWPIVFGVRPGAVSHREFEAGVRDATADDPVLATLTEVKLQARAALGKGSSGSVTPG